MLNVITEKDGSLVTVTPTIRITSDDIAKLRDALDESINLHDRIPALLVHVTSLPGYEGFGALLAHLKLVRDSEKLLPRVALVSDGFLLRGVEPLAKLFVKAEIRHFAEEDIEDAREWARLGHNAPDALKILDGFPNDVLAMEISGRLRGVDYEEVLDPLIDKKLERHDKLKVFLVVNKDFEGATAGAAWDDLKLGLKNFTKYRKMAIVTDLAWLRNGVRLFAPFMPAEVHSYPYSKREIAESWIKT